jgi:hypothetical protein
MTPKRHCEGAERQRIVNAVTWLVGLYGPNAGTEAPLHAFMREHDGDSTAAQFLYRGLSCQRWAEDVGWVERSEAHAVW